MSEMKRKSFKSARRAWLAALFALSTLLVGQVGVAPGLIAVANAEADTCCDHESAHGAEADGADDSLHVLADDSLHVLADDGPAQLALSTPPCPNEGSETPCGPGCDHCTCCPGAVFAVMPALTAYPRFSPVFASLDRPTADPAAGVPGQIFIPPEFARA
ncbi:MAG: hypothetical protein R3F39_09525 [Myxococcota bacterium]